MCCFEREIAEEDGVLVRTMNGDYYWDDMPIGYCPWCGQRLGDRWDELEPDDAP